MWNANKLVEHAVTIAPAYSGDIQESLVDAIDRSGIDKGDAILQWIFKNQSPASSAPFWEGDLDELDTAIAQKEKQYGIEKHTVWHDEETFDVMCPECGVRPSPDGFSLCWFCNNEPTYMDYVTGNKY